MEAEVSQYQCAALSDLPTHSTVGLGIKLQYFYGTNRTASIPSSIAKSHVQNLVSNGQRS